MTEPLRFSIVIPCYNYGHWLARAVHSVLAQDGDDWELLVIDDGSNDDTAQVARELLARHPGRLRFLAQPNRGVAAVRNRGIDETRGDFLIFLDADDELAPGALTACRALLATQPDADLLAGAHRACDPAGRCRRRPVGRLPATARRRLYGYLFGKTLSLSNGATAFRRTLFARRRYPEALRAAEDIPVFAHALATGKVAVTDVELAIIHHHPGSLRRVADAAGPPADGTAPALADGITSAPADDTAIARVDGKALALVDDKAPALVDDKAPALLDDKALALVDEVFSALLPPWALGYRQRYVAQRQLSLFRAGYLAGDRAGALDRYHRALRASPGYVLSRWSYLSKYLRLRCGWSAGRA